MEKWRKIVEKKKIGGKSGEMEKSVKTGNFRMEKKSEENLLTKSRIFLYMILCC